MRIALIRNPLSRRNAGGAHPLPLPTAEPRGGKELRQALAGFRTDGTRVVAVDGGDGTVREVMTALVELDWFPRLAILPGGTTNLIARDVGLPHRRAHGLVQAGVPIPEIQIQRRRLLRLDHAGGSTYGMFLGAAGFRLAWELAHHHLYFRGLGSAATIIAAMALALGRAAGDGPFSTGEAMSVRLDHAAPVEGHRFLLLATTLDNLMLGLWPFWGEGQGLCLLDIAAPPRRLLAALPALARGRPAPWMEDSGYRSCRTNRVELRPTGPVILDGEPFSPDADGKLVLSLGPEMEFIRP